MKLLSRKELKEVAKEIRDKSTRASFKNEYGEKFTIYSDGNFVLMEGDEVNAMVDPKNVTEGMISLFNPAFSVWSVDELLKLGQALVDVSTENIAKRQK
jgi:hypothetical protein